MNKRNWLFLVVVLSVIITNSCKKDENISVPILTTLDVSSITQTTATCGGNITSDGGSTVTVRGVCWSTDTTLSVTDKKTMDGAGVGTFSSSLTGLTGNAVYYIRAYATNSAGTGYGIMMSFKTNPLLATLTTIEPTAITRLTASSGGIITDDGGATITARGVCWSTDTTPTITDRKTTDGTGVGTFSSSLTILKPNTKYFVRAYAITNVGVGYGMKMTFTTKDDDILFIPWLTYGTITDIEGNEYKTIVIGTQTWMAENLKTIHYNNNVKIPGVEENSSWRQLLGPGYCWYNNDELSNKATRGALYNWYTVNTGKLCPTGWHVPSDAEWTILTDYVGGEVYAGAQLKEGGIAHWKSSLYRNNDYGFTALPGGSRGNYGDFGGVGYSGYWWSSTKLPTLDGDYDYNAWYRKMGSAERSVWRNYTDVQCGLSVRCLKDE
jgi:uncharacterized protein (TIGR02145 family)